MYGEDLSKNLSEDLSEDLSNEPHGDRSGGRGAGEVAHQPRSHRFDELMADHARLMASAIRRVCGRSHRWLIPDIEQEVRLALWQRLSSDRAIEHPVSYLYKMAWTTALGVLRRQRPEEVAVEDPLVFEGQPASGPEHDHRDRRLVLDQLLGRLEPEQARALGAYRAGLSHGEVASLFGWSESVARHRIYRGIAKLEKLGKQLAALVLLALIWPWGHAPVEAPGSTRIDPGRGAGLIDEPTRHPDDGVVDPPAGARLDQPPKTLRWPRQTGAWSYRPILHDASGEVVWQGPWDAANRCELPTAVIEKLDAGRWFWTVEVEGEVERPRLGPWVFEIATPSSPTAAEGVPVVRVETGHPAAMAGTEVGDRLLGWRRAEDGTKDFRPLDDPFEVERLLREEALRGPVILRFQRRGEVLEQRVEAGRWRLAVGLPPGGGPDHGSAGFWRRLEEARRRVGEGRHGEAVAILEGALAEGALAEGALAPPHVGYRLAAELGEVYFAAQDFAASERAFRWAARLGRLEESESLTLARHHTDLGVVALARGDLEMAETEHQRALALRRHLAPDSVEVAVSLNNLGVVAHTRGDVARAETLWQGAAELFARSAPDALAAARLRLNLGAAAFSRGDLERAEEQWRRALALRRDNLPESLEVAAVHNNLGLVHGQRGALEDSETHHQRALELRQRLAPESLATARSLHNLSEVIRRRGDLARAASLGRRAAELRLRLAPHHLETAQSFLALGRLAVATSRLDTARRDFETGLGILAQIQDEGGLDTALALLDLGDLEQRDGDPLGAREHFERALELLEEHAQGSLFEASAQRALARLELDQPAAGDRDWVERVEGRLVRAETIVRRLAPDSGALAQTLGLRSQLARALRNHDEARILGLESLAILDRQETLWGGRESERMGFADRFADLYLAVARDLRESDPAAALAVYERYRARRFRALLAGHRKSDEGTRAEPRTPPVATVEEIATALPPGALLVSFLVGDETTLVFALASDGALRGVELDIGRRELGRRVERFGDLVRSPELGEEGYLALLRQGKALRDLLLGSLAPELAMAERLLLVPDGPLDGLPWAALPRVADPAAPGWLIETWPLTVTLSGSVEHDLIRRRGHHAPGPWLVVGSPGDRAAPADLPGSLWETERVVGRVPGAQVLRGEAATETAVRSLAPGRRVLHFALHGVLDAQSPFDSHLVLAPDPVDDDGRRDGLLRAWEVMRELELDAELVTLSACESRGRSARGSGPLGLTMAFHLAGARSVLASHWRVADRPSAVLMDRFVAGLGLGLAKDEALRQAQLAVLRRPVILPPASRAPGWWERLRDFAGLGPQSSPRPFNARHPYFWAAFQLSGDGASSVGPPGGDPSGQKKGPTARLRDGAGRSG